MSDDFANNFEAIIGYVSESEVKGGHNKHLLLKMKQLTYEENTYCIESSEHILSPFEFEIPNYPFDEMIFVLWEFF